MRDLTGPIHSSFDSKSPRKTGKYATNAVEACLHKKIDSNKDTSEPFHTEDAKPFNPPRAKSCEHGVDYFEVESTLPDGTKKMILRRRPRKISDDGEKSESEKAS